MTKREMAQREFIEAWSAACKAIQRGREAKAALEEAVREEDAVTFAEIAARLTEEAA